MTFSGFIVAVVGYGMYRSPHLDWEGFLHVFPEVFSVISREVIRFIEDPFAFIGLIVMIVGIAISYKGLKIILFGEETRSREINRINP